jgi:hypothetical protein
MKLCPYHQTWMSANHCTTTLASHCQHHKYKLELLGWSLPLTFDPHTTQQWFKLYKYTASDTITFIISNTQFINETYWHMESQQCEIFTSLWLRIPMSWNFRTLHMGGEEPPNTTYRPLEYCQCYRHYTGKEMESFALDNTDRNTEHSV